MCNYFYCISITFECFISTCRLSVLIILYVFGYVSNIYMKKMHKKYIDITQDVGSLIL